MSMSPRENMLSLYRRNGYDFVPVEFNLSPRMQQKQREAIGEDTSPAQYYDYREGFARQAVPGPKLVEQDVDWRGIYDEELHEDTYFDAYGVAREGGFKDAMHLKRMHHPMADYDSLEQMQKYPWPEWDLENTDFMTETVEEARENGHPTIGHLACTIWEKAWALRDMTVLMMDMTAGDEKAAFILDKITEDSGAKAAAFAQAGVDILHLGDDIGMQEAPMMSMEMYREWLKPRLSRVIDAARAEKSDILVFYHSCGFVEPFIPDLMDAGVDILNPVQPESMDFDQLHAEYGSELSFNGTLGTQTTMPFGSPDDVREVVHRNLDMAGQQGGLVVAPTHVLEPEVPWENVEAYIQACKEYSG